MATGRAPLICLGRAPWQPGTPPLPACSQQLCRHIHALCPSKAAASGTCSPACTESFETWCSLPERSPRSQAPKTSIYSALPLELPGSPDSPAAAMSMGSAGSLGSQADLLGQTRATLLEPPSPGSPGSTKCALLAVHACASSGLGLACSTALCQLVGCVLDDRLPRLAQPETCVCCAVSHVLKAETRRPALYHAGPWQLASAASCSQHGPRLQSQVSSAAESLSALEHACTWQRQRRQERPQQGSTLSSSR